MHVAGGGAVVSMGASGNYIAALLGQSSLQKCSSGAACWGLSFAEVSPPPGRSDLMPVRRPLEPLEGKPHGQTSNRLAFGDGIAAVSKLGQMLPICPCLRIARSSVTPDGSRCSRLFVGGRRTSSA